MFAMQTSRFSETPVNAGVIQRREHRVFLISGQCRMVRDASIASFINIPVNAGWFETRASRLS
jgi:hypothetical protein